MMVHNTVAQRQRQTRLTITGHINTRQTKCYLNAFTTPSVIGPQMPKCDDVITQRD